MWPYESPVILTPVSLAVLSVPSETSVQESLRPGINSVNGPGLNNFGTSDVYQTQLPDSFKPSYLPVKTALVFVPVKVNFLFLAFLPGQTFIKVCRMFSVFCVKPQ